MALPSALVNGLFDRSVIAPLSSSTTVVSNGRPADGVTLTVAPLLVKLKAPATGTLSAVKRNDEAVTVAGAIGSLNVIDSGAVVPMPTLPPGGLALTTVGATTSGDSV